ncbi:helix-turn-helix transcriptional regulator [Aeromonas caviae]|uniref:helix-turn-helix transcriptional regulator n=1 Tax=Aeromonas caviae TaxID=648 RepID=UPI003CF87165
MNEVITVKEMLGLLRIGRTTLYAEIKIGRIPRPFKLSRNRSGWLKDDVVKLLEQRRLEANAGQ